MRNDASQSQSGGGTARLKEESAAELHPPPEPSRVLMSESVEHGNTNIQLAAKMRPEKIEYCFNFIGVTDVHREDYVIFPRFLNGKCHLPWTIREAISQKVWFDQQSSLRSDIVLRRAVHRSSH